jgi:signal transduction histidine kinase
MIEEAVMSNRKKCALDLTTQLFVGRLPTPADELMSACPHTDAIDIRTDRKEHSGANRHIKIGDKVARIDPTGQSHLHSERLADLIQEKSSICHDLRQYLTVLLANIEFLYEADSAHGNKEDIYSEIKDASEQMTDLIDSLRVLGSDGGTINPVLANLQETAKRALGAVKSRFPWRQRPIKMITRGAMVGKFDARKLERVFFNLLLNACEATTRRGNINVEIASNKEQFQIRVCDDGSGVPAGIRHTLFEPAVTAAKSNGCGFGLAVVKKIINEHQGSVEVESTSELGTVILVKLPRVHQNRCRQMSIARLSSTKTKLPFHSDDAEECPRNKNDPRQLSTQNAAHPQQKMKRES